MWGIIIGFIIFFLMISLLGAIMLMLLFSFSAQQIGITYIQIILIFFGTIILIILINLLYRKI
jgi:hypothetical protein